MCLQHHPEEGPGYVEDWALENGRTVEIAPVYKNGRLPAVSEFDWLVVLGGPMSVYEENEHPWLAKEKALIVQAIEHHKPVVGICLGAQLIAAALGARVYPHGCREIGWFPVTLTEKARASFYFDFLPRSFSVFHWHQDTFDLPDGAFRIASSEACLNQGFQVGDRVLGFQFHMEMTAAMLDGAGLVRDLRKAGEGRHIQPYVEMVKQRRNCGVLHYYLKEILDRMSRRCGFRQLEKEAAY